MTTPMSASPTSIGGLMMQTRRYLSQNLNDELVFTADPYTAGQSSIVLKGLPRRLGPGSLLSWGQSTLYVISSSTSVSNTVEVMAGYDGGPDVDIPANTPLRLNPRFTDYTLFSMLSDSIASLSSPGTGLYGIVAETFAGMRTDDFYPIPATVNGPDPANVLRILQVRSRTDGSRDWTRTTEFITSMTPGNQHIRIFADALAHEVTYAVRFRKPMSVLDDVVADCGMTDTMVDIPVLGVAATLMQGQEARRVNQRAQGDPRRAEDVPITGAMSSGRELYRMYRDRVDEEHSRLVQRFSYAQGAMQ